MDTIFSTLGDHIYSNAGHEGFLVKWELIGPLIKKWSRNREPDMLRIEDMCKARSASPPAYISNHIHLADLQESEGLVCYDGNHRRHVWKSDDIVVVDMMFNASQASVFEAFNLINNSVQIPAIFLDDTCQDVKVEIVALVKEFETYYKSYLSTSSRCNPPNFNRDTLIDNIHNIVV